MIRVETRGWRDAARFEGVAAAKRLHDQLDVERRVLQSRDRYIDVFALIEELGIFLLFEDLDDVLGFCLPHPKSGIMVTTRRSSDLQRYTGAHELGHNYMEHRGSVDTKIMYRGTYASTQVPFEETAAEAFAAECLAPLWLIVDHLKRQKWTPKGHLRNYAVVYQLSLRLGISYEATCIALFTNDLINKSTLAELQKHQPAVAKREALAGTSLCAGHADVWRLTLADTGLRLPCNSDDIFILELPTGSPGAPVWDDSHLSLLPINIHPIEIEEHGVSDGIYKLCFTLQNKIKSEVELLVSVPSSYLIAPMPSNVFGVDLIPVGKETKGFSRARLRILGISQ